MDHDSALTYVTYASLMIEAVPAQFLCLHCGQGGVYLLIEVVLLIISALLARALPRPRALPLLPRGSPPVQKSPGRAKGSKSEAAIQAMTRMLQDFSDTADNLRKLGYKLNEARSKGLIP